MGDSSVTTGSKRNSLRFHFKEELLVSYKTAYQDGESFLINISTGGCVVRKATVSVAVDEKILLSFAIQNLETPLEIQAVCIRLDGDGFAAKFLGIDGGNESRVVKLLAAQARAKSG